MGEKCKLYGLLLGIAVVASGLFSGVRLYAQVDTGTVAGIVLDEGGGGIEGAKLILKNEATSATTTTVTRQDGRYAFLVKSGVYTVAVEVQDFASASQSGVVVGVQQYVSVDFSLHGAKSETPAPAPSVKPSVRYQDTLAGQVVGATELDSLPVRDRNFTFLTRLAPGTAPRQEGPKGLETTGSFVSHGMRAEQTNYLLDGVDINSHMADFLTGNAFTVLPSMDSLQEFRVYSPSYGAFLGRTAGPVLNAVTRTGTNQFHGSFWDYFGNDKLNAANYFDNAAQIEKASYRKNQFGLTLGGPISLGKYNGKDRSFFFLNYEQIMLRQGVPTVTTVPTRYQRNSGFTDFSDLLDQQADCTGSTDLLGRSYGCGQMFDPATTRVVLQGGVDPVTGLTATSTGYVREPFAGNVIPADRIGASAASLLGLYPNPTVLFDDDYEELLDPIRDNYTTNAYNWVNTKVFNIRADHRFSSQSQIYARFSYFDDPRRQAGPFAGVADGGGYSNVADSHNFVLSATNISSPTSINEFRLGFNGMRAGRAQPYANDLTNIPDQYGGIQGVPQVTGNGGLPTLLVGNLSQLGSSPGLWANNPSSTISISDNMSKIWRRHTFRGGFDLMHMSVSTLQPLYSRGQFSFSGLYTSVADQTDPTTGIAQLLLTPITATTTNGTNYVGGPNQVLASNITNMNNRRNYLAGYFGDTWQFRPGLTVDIGFRWEYFEPMKEKYSAMANFVPGTAYDDAEYLIALARGEDELSDSFLDVMEDNGIDPVYVSRGSLVQATKKNIAPRLGLAYRISPKLVARFGYGMYYGGLGNQGVWSNLAGNYPFQVNYAFNSPSSGAPIIYPAIDTNATLEYGLVGIPLTSENVDAGEGLVLRGIQRDYKTPYTQGVNFGLEYELDRQTTLKVAYGGSMGRHLEINPGLNEVSQLVPTRLQASSYAPFPDFAYGSSYITTAGTSYYHSAQLSLIRKLSQGLMFNANYTFSKARTNALDLFDSNGGSSYRAPYIDDFGIQGDYGLADFDVRHAFNFSGGYELPFGAGKRYLAKSGGIGSKILKGWNLNWAFTYQAGQPVTIPCTISTGAGTGCYALLVEDGDPTAGVQSGRQYWNASAFTNPEVTETSGQSDYTPLGGARSQVLGPNQHQLDIALRRTFKSSENTHLDFRVEVFNVLNHANFALPTHLNFNDPSTFGLSTATSNNPRQVQFAVKIHF